MSVRSKQNWIKDILTKSGTEITEVNTDKSEGWFEIPFFLFSRFERTVFFFENLIFGFHSFWMSKIAMSTLNFFLSLVNVIKKN